MALYNEICGCRPYFTSKAGGFHFYSNEGNKPIHVHAEKGDAECKYWLHPGAFDIEEEFEYNCTPRLRREVRKIIFQDFEQIVAAWRDHLGEHRAQ